MPDDPRPEPTDRAPGDAGPAGSHFRSVVLEVVAQCPSCGNGIPVPGAVQEVTCGHCGTRCPMDLGFWKRVLADPLHEALGLPEGKGRSAQLRSDPPVRLLYGRMLPRCRGCGSFLPSESLAEAAVTSERGLGSLFCPACGTRNTCRVVPRWFADVHAAPGFLVNEPLPEDDPLPAACPSCQAPVVPTPGIPQRNCMRCGASLRERRHSTVPVGQRWYILANLGGSVGVVPREALTFCDLAVEPRGGMGVAWIAESPVTQRQECLVGVLDQRGLLRWVAARGAFGPRSTLHFVPRKEQLALVDPADGVGLFFDARTGAFEGGIDPPVADRDDLVDLRDHLGVAFDVDGTFVVASDRFGGDPQIARFERTGRRLPLWDGMGPEEEVFAFRGREEAAPVQTPVDRPVRIPPDAAFSIGWDGRFYVVDRTTGDVARFARDGSCEGVARPQADLVERVLDVGVDEQGTVHLLFRHTRRFGDDPAEHVARIRPDGTFEVWLGAFAERSPIILGPAPERMKVRGDGTVLLGGALAQLIAVDPSRRVLWHHPGRLRHQRRALEAPNRRGRHGRGRVRRISSVNTSSS